MNLISLYLGTSFIKGAVLGLDDLSIRHVERLPFPKPIAALRPSSREVPADPIIAAARALLQRLLAHAPEAQGIVICSQLHGLIFATAEGSAVSNFISWQDQRAVEAMSPSAASYFDEIKFGWQSDCSHAQTSAPGRVKPGGAG